MPPGTRMLTASTGERYRFDAGSFSLELLVTGGSPRYPEYEVLHTPEDLAHWLVGSRLAGIAPLAVADLRIRPADLRATKQFRDTYRRVAEAVVAGERPRPEDLVLLNRCAGPAPRPAVDPVTGRLGWATPVTGEQVLGAAARDAIVLVGGDRASRLRRCAGADCHLLFLDTSRPGNRRWCSMERCGNRHKVTTYRVRQRPNPD